MRVTRVQLRDFRNYEDADVALAEGLTVVVGPNGAGKTNLLEGIYFACTAHSPRTSNERELVRRGAQVARVELEVSADDAAHRIEVGFRPGEPKRVRVDGSAVGGAPLAGSARPLVNVFLPERLELVKGAPAARRGHLDQLVAAIWPSRAETRSAYSRSLAQRNSLLGRIRAGLVGPGALDPWDLELSRHGIQMMVDRAEAVEGLRAPFAELAERLGLAGGAELRYRPRSASSSADGLAAELRERREADLERGFTAHGPHRDDLQLLLDGTSLRAYGSQGQQRAALLALLFAERELLAARRSHPPLMLLDDVMSELDGERRELLASLLRSGGQAVITATEAEHVPGAGAGSDGIVEVQAGRARSRVGVGA
ncbi:MAG TPA: DNA replication and repair protein RecF [Thermoleophilaceae bacterium]